MAASTPASASSPASIIPVGPPPAITTACSAIAILLCSQKGLELKCRVGGLRQAPRFGIYWTRRRALLPLITKIDAKTPGSAAFDVRRQSVREGVVKQSYAPCRAQVFVHHEPHF